MALKVGINGFGRIGRQVLRAALLKKADIEFVDGSYRIKGTDRQVKITDLAGTTLINAPAAGSVTSAWWMHLFIPAFAVWECCVVCWASWWKQHAMPDSRG